MESAGPLAITSTRSVRFTSPDEGRYTRADRGLVARCRLSTNSGATGTRSEIGVVPSQVRSDRQAAADRRACDGGRDGVRAEVGSAVTVPVADEVAAAEPSRLVAVSVTRSVWRCRPLRGCKCDRSRRTSAQPIPSARQRRHW